MRPGWKTLLSLTRVFFLEEQANRIAESQNTIIIILESVGPVIFFVFVVTIAAAHAILTNLGESN